MLNLLANATTIVNPKQKAIDAVAPNATFQPFPALEVLTVVFFIASAVMMWLIVRAGKGSDYNS